MAQEYHVQETIQDGIAAKARPVAGDPVRQRQREP
jgi:hypothetical protein